MRTLWYIIWSLCDRVEILRGGRKRHNIYLSGDEGHEPLTSWAVLLERLRHVAVQAIDVLEVKVWQEEIIDVLRGGPVTGHEQRHRRHVVVDHDDRVAVDAVAAGAIRCQHVLHIYGGRRRVRRDILHRLRSRRRVLAVRCGRHRWLDVLVTVPEHMDHRVLLSSRFYRHTIT